MVSAIVPHSSSIPAPYVPSMETIKSASALAEIAWRSGISKAKSLEAAIFVALYALELGIPAMTGLRTIYSVNGGAPTCSGEAMLAMVRRSTKVKVTIPNPGSVTDSATVKFKRLDNGDEGEFTFTLEMGKKAGLLEGVNWKKYPHMMMIWRALSMGVKLMCSDIAGGLYTHEELYPDVPVDENGELLIVEGTATRVDNPQPPTTTPVGTWADVNAVKYLFDSAKISMAPDITLIEVARLAGIARADDYKAWNEKYETGKAAGLAIKTAFEQEMNSTPPAQPKSQAEQPPSEPERPKLIIPDGTTAQLTSNRARYVQAGSTGYTEFLSAVPARLYGTSETFKTLGERYVGTAAALKAANGQFVDLPGVLIFEWELAANSEYATVKKDTLKEDIPF